MTLLAHLATTPDLPHDDLGWRAVDLGFPVAALPEEAFVALSEAVEGQGVAVVCVDSAIGAGSITDDFGRDLEELRVLTERCPALGTRLVRIGSDANADLHADDWEYRVLRRVRELALRAEQADLVLLHPTTGGWPSGDPGRLGRLLAEAATPGLRLLHHTATGPFDGAVAGYTAHVRVPDVRAAGLTADLSSLVARGYTGALTLADGSADAGAALQALTAPTIGRWPS